MEWATSRTPTLTFGSLSENRLTRSWILFVSKTNNEAQTRARPYLRQRLPARPEVGVSDQADSFAELCLDGGRRGNHQPNKLFLDRPHLIERELVVAIDILQIDSELESFLVAGGAERTT